MAEREGFEPSIRYKRIHTFQACSLSHSDTSPESVAILSGNCRFISRGLNESTPDLKKGQRIICLVWVLCQPEKGCYLNKNTVIPACWGMTVRIVSETV